MRAHSLTCTFCRKSEHEVRKLVAGPGVYICDTCVVVAYRIVSEEGRPAAPERWWRRLAVRIRSLLEPRARLLGSPRGLAGHAGSPRP